MSPEDLIVKTWSAYDIIEAANEIPAGMSDWESDESSRRSS